MTAQDLRIATLEDEYDVFTAIPDHKWGRDESRAFDAWAERMRAAYDEAGTDEDDRIVL